MQRLGRWKIDSTARESQLFELPEKGIFLWVLCG